MHLADLSPVQATKAEPEYRPATDDQKAEVAFVRQVQTRMFDRIEAKFAAARTGSCRGYDTFEELAKDLEVLRKECEACESECELIAISGWT